jgi:hypothetical protein
MAKWMKMLGLGLVCVGVLFLPAGMAGPEDSAYEEVPGVRQPTLRRIHPQRDAATIERIELHRAKLPAQYRGRFNFAWVAAKIDGLEKTEYFAHSGIQSLDKLSSAEAKKLAGISVRPEKGRYYTLCVNQSDIVDGPNCWQRTVDTEYKIIEEMVSQLPDTSAKGRVKLYTDLPPCASCWNVMKQFMAEYTNVHVQVLYKQR